MYPDTIKVIVESLTNLSTSIIAIYFITGYFSPKQSGKRKYANFAAGVMVYFALLSLINYVTYFEGGAGITYVIAVFLYAAYALDGKIVDKIIASFLWLFIVLVTTIFVFTLVRLISGRAFADLITANDFARLYILVPITISKLILSQVIIKIRKRDEVSLYKRDGNAVIGMYCLVFAMMVALFWLEIGGDAVGGRHAMILFLLSGYIGIIIWIYYYGLKVSNYHYKIRDLQSLAIQNDYLGDFAELCDEMRIIRHDLKIAWKLSGYWQALGIPMPSRTMLPRWAAR